MKKRKNKSQRLFFRKFFKKPKSSVRFKRKRTKKSGVFKRLHQLNWERMASCYYFVAMADEHNGLVDLKAAEKGFIRNVWQVPVPDRLLGQIKQGDLVRVDADLIIVSKLSDAEKEENMAWHLKEYGYVPDFDFTFLGF